MKKMRTFKAFTAGLFLLCGAASTLQAQEWVSEGPAPNTNGQVENVTPNDEVIGAIHTVVAHPTNPDILWVGATNGGIWRTDNATATSPTWVRQTDSPNGTLRSLSIGAMELDPTDNASNNLVAGIGGYSSFRRTRGERIGVLRSSDGGTNWTIVPGNGLDRPNISGIALRGNTIVISADTSTPNTFATVGVFRSTDNGNNFTQVSIGDGSDTGLPGGLATDLVGDPSNPNRLFTATRFAGSVGGVNGIYRTDDLGVSWTKVSDGAIDVLLANTNAISNVEMAVGNNNNVYVAICTSGRLNGLFRSGNGGGTWTALDIPSPTIHPGFQASIHLSIVADPTDENIVYVGGDRQDTLNNDFPNALGANDFSGNLFRIDASEAPGSQAFHLTHSNTKGAAGGGTASNSSPHADSREMVFDAAGNLIETDDGGIYKRTQPRSNEGDWVSINGTLAVTEFHSIVYDSFSNVIMGGAQDTGSSFQEGTDAQQWFSITTADGGDVAVDDTRLNDRSTRYSSFQNLGNFLRIQWDINNEFLNFSQIELMVADGAPLQPVFLTPIELNHLNPLRMIILGANGTYESDDQGDTLIQIATNPAFGGGLDPIAYGSNDNENMLYVGSGTSVFVRTAAHPAPLTLSGSFPGTTTVSDIKLNRNQGNMAFVTTADGVYMTDNAGGSWTDITGNMGSFDPGSFFSLAHQFDPGTLYLGTSRGVFQARAEDNYATWSVTGTGLPNAQAFDLDYDDADRVLIAGLMGRGAWSFDTTQVVITPCPLDLNDDGQIDNADYLVARNNWRSETLDTNEDGILDILDMLAILNGEGECPQ